MELTSEQLEAVAHFRMGSHLRLEAGAGVGKTSLLEVMGRATSKFGTYTAFNRAVVQDAAARMPGNIQASTTHSLAFRAVGRRYAHRLDAPRIRSAELARRLNLSHLTVRYGSQSKVLQAGFLASLVQRTLTAFCFTADPEPGEQHVPYLDGIDAPLTDDDGSVIARGWENNRAVRAHIAAAIEIGWADLTNEAGDLMRFSHDAYMKIWQLGQPTIPGEFILLDEAQDTAPVLLDVVHRQSAQVVAVGDTQQQIYAWRGASNALAQIESEATCYLTKSWRFGPAIADVANVLLEELDAALRLTGCDVESMVGPIVGIPDAVLCRSNAGAVTTLLGFQRDGVRVHLVGSAGQQVVAFAKAIDELRATAWTAHPELACFRSWDEVLSYTEQDPSGGELALMVSLVEEFGTDQILASLANMPAESDAQVVVSTAHAAKGRQWPTVRLAGDFQEPEGDGADAELRLLYVAATRAQRVLDVRACQPLVDMLNVEQDDDEQRLAL